MMVDNPTNPWFNRDMSTTTTTPSLRHQVRLLSMSTDELTNLASADDRYCYTAADHARRNRAIELAGWELARRIDAKGVAA